MLNIFTNFKFRTFMCVTSFVLLLRPLNHELKIIRSKKLIFKNL